MNMQTKKIELIQLLASISDVKVLDALLKLKDNGVTDWWNGLSDEEKASIQKGIDDANSKKLTPHSEAQKLYDKWV